MFLSPIIQLFKHGLPFFQVYNQSVQWSLRLMQILLCVACSQHISQLLLLLFHYYYPLLSCIWANGLAIQAEHSSGLAGCPTTWSSELLGFKANEKPGQIETETEAVQWGKAWQTDTCRHLFGVHCSAGNLIWFNCFHDSALRLRRSSRKPTKNFQKPSVSAMEGVPVARTETEPGEAKPKPQVEWSKLGSWA